jgi:hypothetical protein
MVHIETKTIISEHIKHSTSVKENMYIKSDLKNGNLTVTDETTIISSESQRSSISNGGDLTFIPKENY